MLISTGGSTIQEVIVSSPVFRYNSRHDPWPTHGIGCPLSPGIQNGLSGLSFGAFGCYLKDGNAYDYFTEQSFATGTDFDNWSQAWNNFYLPDGSGPWFGEGWNRGGRNQHTQKILASEFALWQAAH